MTQQNDVEALDAWRVVRSRFVVDDAWLRLRADTCLDTRGDEVSPYYVTVSPDWVCVVPFTSSGDLILVEEYRHGAAITTLGFPGGGIVDTDDGPAAAAERELLEETGLRGAQAIVVGSVWANAASRTNRVHMVVVTDVRAAAAPVLERGEQPRLRMMAYHDFKREALGRISQSYHVAALPFVDLWLADRA